MTAPHAPESLPSLPPRRRDSHKGDYGRALLVGGSRGMSGAIALAGMATVRSGAGLTTLAVPDRCLETVAGFDPCVMTVPLACDEEGRLTHAAAARVLELAESATCVAIGPGLGRSASLVELVAILQTAVRCPMVIDADALHALAASRDALLAPAGPRILTPHPGEFRRLVAGAGLADDDPRQQAVKLARQSQMTIVLKGHQTLVTDGATTALNTTGNPGMATGGSGDVLTGVICALVCQQLAPLAAARLGVHLHGLAGDLARDQVGEVSLTARDLIDHLPAALLTLVPLPP